MLRTVHSAYPRRVRGRTPPDDMLVHPRHQEMQPVLAALIQQLRDCEAVEGGGAFPHDCSPACESREGLPRVQARRDRLAKGKSPHHEVPEPQSGRDLAEAVTWTFERDVRARLARQLRSVGDVLAFRVFASIAGPSWHSAATTSRASCTARRGWKPNGSESSRHGGRPRLALLHDMTNCLRIGDTAASHTPALRRADRG